VSQEKFYRYFKVTGQEVVYLLAAYEPIDAKRKQVIKGMLEESGAAGYAESRGWGENGSTVQALWFLADHDFGAPVTIAHRTHDDGKDMVVVRGKGTSKAAKDLNAKLRGYIKAANDQLTDLPSFHDYLIKHYGVACTGLGGRVGSGFGVAMLQTKCGVAPGSKDTLLFAVPTKSEGCRQPEIPASFTEMTYGQFYDLSEGNN